MVPATALSRKGLVVMRLLWITSFCSPVAALAFISVALCRSVQKFALSLTFWAFLSICSLDV